MTICKGLLIDVVSFQDVVQRIVGEELMVQPRERDLGSSFSCSPGRCSFPPGSAYDTADAETYQCIVDCDGSHQYRYVLHGRIAFNSSRRHDPIGEPEQRNRRDVEHSLRGMEDRGLRGREQDAESQQSPGECWQRQPDNRAALECGSHLLTAQRKPCAEPFTRP